MFTEQEQLDELYDIIAGCPCDESECVEKMNCDECSAEAVYGANYRKLAEDEMIISKAEYEEYRDLLKNFDTYLFEYRKFADEMIETKRRQALMDLHNEFSRYKCYEHADRYLREYAAKRGIKLEE